MPPSSRSFQYIVSLEWIGKNYLQPLPPVAPFGVGLCVEAESDLFRSLFDEAPDAMLLADDAGRLVAANRAACARLRTTLAEIRGRQVDRVALMASPIACVWQRFSHAGRGYHLTILREWPHRDVARPPAPPLHVAERVAIDHALEQTEGNVTRAARLLGIDRRTLQRRINPR